MILLKPYQAFIIGILLIFFLVFAIVLVLKKEQKQSLKIIWILLILLMPVIGAFVYYLKVLFDMLKEK
jgi:O-antigen/teichoic acid export membrane protein